MAHQCHSVVSFFVLRWEIVDCLSFCSLTGCQVPIFSYFFLFFWTFLFFSYFSEKFLFFPIFLHFGRFRGLDIKFNNCKMGF